MMELLILKSPPNQVRLTKPLRSAAMRGPTPKPLVSDGPWAVTEPLLPNESPKPENGGPCMNDRVVLTGVPFVPEAGVPWEMVLQGVGRGLVGHGLLAVTRGAPPGRGPQAGALRTV